MSFSALVVDDEPLARDELAYLLQKTGKVTVVGEAATGAEAIAAVARLHPDVVFLDVRMPEMDGFAVASTLLEMANPPIVVFATAHDEFALQAFEVSAVDYLLKPLDASRVDRSVARLERALSQPQTETLDRLDQFLRRMEGPRPLQRIPMDANGRTMLMSPSEVLYFSTGATATIVWTTRGEFTTHFNLQDLEERLGTGLFFRVHRQYIVNLEHVQEFIPWPGGTASLVVGPKLQVPVARTHVKRIKELLGLS